MNRILEIKLTEDLDTNINDSKYEKDQILNVVEFECFDDSYAYYYKINKQGEIVDALDWIPKPICKIIKEINSMK